jgi:hypothetical protein
MPHYALHVYASHIARMEDPSHHFWVRLGIVPDHRSRELLKVPSRVFRNYRLVACLPQQTGRQSSRATQSTELEISLLLFEERQQLLEDIIPMAVDFPGERVTKARRIGMDRFPVC